MTQAQAQALAKMHAANAALTPEERKARSAAAAEASKARKAGAAKAGNGGSDAATATTRARVAPVVLRDFRVLLSPTGAVLAVARADALPEGVVGEWALVNAPGMQRAGKLARKLARAKQA